MKRFMIALSLCLLLACAASPADAADKGDEALKKEIAARYKILAEASDKNDGMKAMSLFGKGYVNTDLAGTERPGSVVAGAVVSAMPDDSRKSRITITALKQDGGKIVVEQSYDLTTVRATEGGGKTDIHMVTSSTDTWVKEDGAWVLQKSVANAGDVYMGKVHVARRVRGEAPAGPAAAKEDKAADKAAEQPAAKD